MDLEADAATLGVLRRSFDERKDGVAQLAVVCRGCCFFAEGEGD
jgi:hypothetical protein